MSRKKIKILFTKYLLWKNHKIIRENSFDIVFCIYWYIWNNKKIKSDKVKEILQSLYFESLNQFNEIWMNQILFIKSDKGFICYLNWVISQFLLNMKEHWYQQNDFEFYSYWLWKNWNLNSKYQINEITFDIEWRFIWTKIINNLYYSKEKNRSRKKERKLLLKSKFWSKEWKYNIQYFIDKEELNSEDISLLTWIYSSWVISKEEFIQLLSKIKNWIDFEVDLLEWFIQDIDIEINWFDEYDFDSLFFHFLDDETKKIVEDKFEEVYKKNMHKDNFFEEKLNEIKKKWYIHLWMVWFIVSKFLRDYQNIREAYEKIKEFYDQYIIWWFNSLNASIVILFFKFWDNKIFKYEEISDYWLMNSYLEVQNNKKES